MSPTWSVQQAIIGTVRFLKHKNRSLTDISDHQQAKSHSNSNFNLLQMEICDSWKEKRQQFHGYFRASVNPVRPLWNSIKILLTKGSLTQHSNLSFTVISDLQPALFVIPAG